MQFLNTIDGNIDKLDNKHASDFRPNQLQYIATTATAEGWYRVATIPINSQFKNAIFKVKAYTATGTVTESTIIVNVAYYSGNYGSQYSGITANTSHSYQADTNAENGWVLRYVRISFDGTNGYIDLYKVKTTTVTIEIEPLVESDWIWSSGALTVNPTIGTYRNTSVWLNYGLCGNAIIASSASSAAYSKYGIMGTNTLSNTTDKTGQWEYFGNWYFEYNVGYLKGRSGNIRVRMQELSYDGSNINLDSFILNIKVGLGYHADANAFNSLVPIFSLEIEGDTTLTENDVCALVYSSSTTTKYIRFYIKLKSANTIYCINPEQGYGRSFATTSYAQTTVYSNFNYAGDQALISELPTPVQGSVVYATIRMGGNADTLNNQNGSYYLNYDNLTNKPASLPANGGNSDMVDGKHASELAFYQSTRNFVNGTLIETNIDYSVVNGEPWLLEIEGNSYGAISPFDIKAQGYIYGGTVINCGGFSNGASISGLVLFNYNNKLCFWFPPQSYWQGFNIFISSSNAGIKSNRLLAITDVLKPSGITKEVIIPIKQTYISQIDITPGSSALSDGSVYYVFE